MFASMEVHSTQIKIQTYLLYRVKILIMQILYLKLYAMTSERVHNWFIDFSKALPKSLHWHTLHPTYPLCNPGHRDIDCFKIWNRR